MPSANLALQMVLGQYGHGDSVHSSSQFALQRRMALLDIGRHLCPERGTFHSIFVHFLATIYPLPTDLDGHAKTSDSIAFLGHFSHGSCDDR